MCNWIRWFGRLKGFCHYIKNWKWIWTISYLFSAKTLNSINAHDSAQNFTQLHMIWPIISCSTFLSSLTEPIQLCSVLRRFSQLCLVQLGSAQFFSWNWQLTSWIVKLSLTTQFGFTFWQYCEKIKKTKMVNSPSRRASPPKRDRPTQRPPPKVFLNIHLKSHFKLIEQTFKMIPH